jgi:hypothetical protein
LQDASVSDVLAAVQMLGGLADLLFVLLDR